MRLVVDQSLKRNPHYEDLIRPFEVVFVGGAVMNVIHVITGTHTCYLKAPKKRLGGCAIWDLAAVAIMTEQARGTHQFIDGSPMHLNRPDSVFFNDVGFVFTSPDLNYESISEYVKPVVTYEGTGEKPL